MPITYLTRARPPVHRAPLLGMWLIAGELRAHPLRLVMACAAIALGVALGFAIHLINAAAFNEFSAAVKSLSGQSDLQVRGARPFMDDVLYPDMATHEGVILASPVLEFNVQVQGQNTPLKVLGLDPFRAAAITPDLLGVPAEGKAFDVLADDALYLSPAAMEWLKVKQGDTVQLRSGANWQTLRVAGGIVSARAGQRLAVMDIAAAQWRFNLLGQISRVELKLAEGVNRDQFKEALTREFSRRGLPLVAVQTEDTEQRSANMSRAYRVNLTVLALVALFTGAFLVFSSQALSVLRRRSQFALLRVLGYTRGQLLRQILAEGVLLGLLGAALGVAAGYGLAALALRFFGGDLGGGYFPGVKPSVQFAPMAACIYFALGVGVAILGCAVPALEAARAHPAQALKAGSEEIALSRLGTPWPALGGLTVAAVLTQLPPLGGLPIFGYLAVALLLISGIALMPRLAASAFSFAGRLLPWRNAVLGLAQARLANAPNQASIALGGVLASFSLMVAMAIMVASFRVSVDDWLGHILPADLYVRSGTATEGGLKPEQASAIANTPGIARANFLRLSSLTLDPGRPPVALVAQPIDAGDPGKTLPLVGDSLPVPANAVPIWASEAMADLYGYRVGQTVILPLKNADGSAPYFVVAGIWRDYVRQFGAIQMRLLDYQRLTGDTAVNDSALWLAPGTSAAAATAAIKQLPFGGALEFAEPGDIRAASLRIFDRSFVITYLLEGVAIVIGLFGVAATFSAQTLARAREFGMLRHIGVTRAQVLGVLALEGGLLTTVGILVGFALGWLISLILVFIVNPQSFHWSMQLHMPWRLLGAVAALLLVSSALTAVIAGRHAVAGSAVRAVREDW